MPRPHVMPPEEKIRLVLAILADEMSIAEAARRATVSAQSVSNWKRRLRGRRRVFNTIRPHEALGMQRPQEVYLAAIPNFPDPEPEPES